MSPIDETFPRDKSCFVVPYGRCTFLPKPLISHILSGSSQFLSQKYLQLVALVVIVDGKGLPPQRSRARWHQTWEHRIYWLYFRCEECGVAWCEESNWDSLWCFIVACCSEFEARSTAVCVCRCHGGRLQQAIFDKTCNVRINVTSRCVRVTIVAVEK